MEYQDLSMLGFPEYRIGTDGSVWSWKCRAGTRVKRWKQLKPWAVRGGYLVIGLKVNGIRHCRFVHRLVLEAFVGVCPEGMEACHANNDPTDNRLDNLRWDTPKNNCIDRKLNGKHYFNTGKGETHGMAKLNWEQVREIRSLASKYKQVELAKMFNVTPTNICEILKEKIWKENSLAP